MKKAVLTVGIIVALFAAVSCNKKDEHSLGKFVVDIATVIPEGENAYSLLLDNGKRLWPAASDIRYAPAYNQRVFVNFTTLSDELNGYDHFVKVNNIWNILTKQAIELTPQNADSIGHDPIKINGAWIGNDFLNVDFMFNYGGVKPHAINLAKNALSSENKRDTIDLEFRHNSYNSNNDKLYEGFVCFDLKPFKQNDADSVVLAIKVKDWDREKTYNIVYRYNQAAMRSTLAETPIPVVSSNEYY